LRQVSLAVPPRQLFFCTGLPKSGTTFLRSVLNEHPEVACAEEQDLGRLTELLNQAVESYNRRAVGLDLRTGGHGRPAFDRSALVELVRAALFIVVRTRAAGKPIAGAKDNHLFARLESIGALFPEARFLCIVRNPLDRAISAWHHNLRLAEKEKDARHSEIVLKHGSLEGWVLHLCRRHRTDMAQFQAASQRSERLRLRYEDLVADPLPQFRRIFRFLGAEAGDPTLRAILQSTTLDRLRAKSGDPDFFRAGSMGAGVGELSPAFRQQVDEQFAAELAQLGYRITRDGLELLPLDLD
jgi:hypothetical protein